MDRIKLREMKIPSFCKLGLVSATFAVLLFAGCSVNVQKGSNGQDKNVDIRTPVGGIHVSKGADVADTGLSVYPGARPKPETSGHGDQSANVSISGLGYGLRVTAVEYESDDQPEKLIAFYKDQLRKYGSVLECHSSGHLDVTMQNGNHMPVCDSNSGKNVELKAGTDENQHIVAIEPEGNGARFSLVYVRTHGKEADI